MCCSFVSGAKTKHDYESNAPSLQEAMAISHCDRLADDQTVLDETVNEPLGYGGDLKPYSKI